MKRIIALLLSFVITFSVVAVAEETTQGEELYAKLLEMVDFIKENHIDATANDDPIKKGLIKMFDTYPDMYTTFVNFMFQSYDKYSYYLDTEDYKLAYDYTTYVGGIGITMEVKEDGAYVKSVIEGGEAEKAGVRANDKLLTADGVSLAGFSTDMIGEIIRGPVGTTVNITVLRDGKELSFTVPRFAMKNSPVSASLAGDGVAYMRITNFEDANTYLDFAVLYKSLPQQGIKTVILDLRDNPGGELSVAINTIERLISDKDIPYLMSESTNPRRVRTYSSIGLGWDATKMVILVNENTASSAELVAGSLHDLGYATLVGKKTYGKGKGQLHLQTAPTEIAVLSNHLFYLPITGSYDGVGISPDVSVELGKTYYHLPPMSPMPKYKAIYIGESDYALALEQRLCELGYFSGTPDKIADGATFLAVNRFQRDNKMDITKGYCNAQTAMAIDDAVYKIDGRAVYTDTQYERALTIARGYAKNDTKPTLPDMGSITFGE